MTQTSKKELRENLKEIRAQKAEINAQLRKFKKANGSNDPEKIKDKELKAELEGMLEKQAELEAQMTALKEQISQATSGREKYTYGKIKDPETGEFRDMTALEKKRWRAHARGVAAKEGINSTEVQFDPDFFAPKAKKAKKVEIEEGDEPAKEKPAKAAKAGLKSKKAKRAQLQD